MEVLILQTSQLLCLHDRNQSKNHEVRLRQRLKLKTSSSLSVFAPSSSSSSPLSQLSPLLSPHQWRPPLHDASLLRGFLCSLVSQVNTCMGQRREGGREGLLVKTRLPFLKIIFLIFIQQVKTLEKKHNLPIPTYLSLKYSIM